MESSVVRELTRILDEFVALSPAGALPRQPFDPEWVSPCQVGEPAQDGTIAWRPRRRIAAPDWSGLERALGAPLHPDVAEFYGSFWSDPVPVRAEEGAAVLIQVWNERDHERLQENLIGHALQKMRRREPLTLFVACTDEGDLTLGVDNATGAVVLEQPGQPPLRQVAATLAAFLARLEPAEAPSALSG